MEDCRGNFPFWSEYVIRILYLDAMMAHMVLVKGLYIKIFYEGNHWIDMFCCFDIFLLVTKMAHACGNKFCDIFVNEGDCEDLPRAAVAFPDGFLRVLLVWGWKCMHGSNWPVPVLSWNLGFLRGLVVVWMIESTAQLYVQGVCCIIRLFGCNIL